MKGSGWEGWAAPILLAVIGGVVALGPSSRVGSRSFDTGLAGSGRQALGPEQQRTFVSASPWEDPLLAVSSLDAPAARGSRGIRRGILSGVAVASVIDELRASLEVESPVRHTFQLPSPSELNRPEDGFGSIEVICVDVGAGVSADSERSRRQTRLAVRQAAESSDYRSAPRDKLYPIFSERMPGGQEFSNRYAYECFRRNADLLVVLYVPMDRFPRNEVLRETVLVATELAWRLENQVEPDVVRRAARRPDSAQRVVTRRVGPLWLPALALRPPLERIVIQRNDSSDLIADMQEIAREPIARQIRGMALGRKSVNVDVVNTGSTMSIESLRERLWADTEKFGYDASVLAGVIEAMERREEPEGSAAADAGVRSWPHPCQGWRIGRVLGSDERLIAKLVRELQLRRRALPQRGNGFAIITPAANAYASAFEQSLKETLEGATEETRPTLSVLKYFGGLDAPPQSDAGRAAYERYSQQVARAVQDGAPPVTASTPLGMHRLDYLTRQLRACRQELEGRGERLAAVLVCAFQSSDKRPIIQLVRREFPNALVLTADMDAALADSADLAIMRNVIVASHLDLSLGAAWQAGYGPFRTNYQTAQFLAFRYLMARDPSLADGLDVVGRVAPPGQVYEIGRRGPVRLGGERSSDGVSSYYPADSSGPPIAASRNLAWGTGLLAAGAMLMWIWLRPRPPAPRRSGGSVQTNNLSPVPTLAQETRPPWRLVRLAIAMMLLTALLPPLVFMERSRTISFAQLGLAALALLSLVWMAGVTRWTTVFRRRASIIGAIVPAVVILWAALMVWLVGSNVEHSEIRQFVWAGLCMVGLFGCSGVAVLVWAGMMKSPRPAPGACAELTAYDEPDGQSGRTDVWRSILSSGFAVLAVLSLVACVIGLGVWLLPGAPDGEPWGWFDGVSAWPTVLLRLVTAVVAVAFLWRCMRTVTQVPGHASCAQVLGPGKRFDLRASQQGGKHSFHAYLKRFTVIAWQPPLSKDSARKGSLCMSRLLAELSARCERKAIITRLLPYLVIVGSVMIGSMAIFEVPEAPIRGQVLFLVHASLMVILAFLINVVAMVVFDASVLAMRYMRFVSLYRSEWPRELTERVARQRGVPIELVGSWLDVESIAKMTRDVSGLIYYPAILLVLTVAAWYPGIDAWDPGPLMILIYAAGLPVCAIAAFTLRSSAARARRNAVNRLRSDIAALSAADETVMSRWSAWSIERGDERRVMGAARAGTEPGEIQFEIKTGYPRPEAYIESLRMLVDGSPVARDEGLDPDPLLAAALVHYASREVVEHETGGGGGQEEAIMLSPQELRASKHAPIRSGLQKLAKSEERRARRKLALERSRNAAESLAVEIEGISEGAFVPWTEDPVFRGVVLPIAGSLVILFAEWVNLAVRSSGG
ncbi:MAG: hypothetical protein AAGG07_10380 [Planctomycetota bacterium]